MSDFLAAARTEAARLQHDYVGTEHLLLALVQGAEPALLTVLGTFAATPDQLRERIEKRCPQGKGTPADPEAISLRSGARRALEQARGAAGGGEPTAQQLLGALLTDGRGVVAASLGDLGVPVAKVREALGFEAPAAAPVAETAAPASRPEKAPKRQEKQERAEKAERTEKPERPPRPEKAPKAERPPRPERAEGRAERAETPRRGERREESGPVREEPRLSRNEGPPRIAPVHEPFLTWRKLPLLAVPASLYLGFAGGFPPLLVFGMACVAVLPLAGYMGEATEHLAARTGPALGGLLNATFGNAAELIIAIVALQAGKIELVKASITGSILGNLLLILGLSLIAGGLGKSIIRFNRTTAGMSAGMMALAVTGLIFPTLFHGTHQGDAAILTELHLSEAVAVVLALTYAFSLLFSLKTHKRILSGDPHPTSGPLWSVPAAIGVLALATVGVAVESEILVHAVEGVTAGTTWLSETFLGLIIIPIIGNAAEHATAIVVARKGKIDLALQIAMGSSAQVALLVAPVLVFAGAVFGPTVGGEYMNLVFSPLEVVAMGLSTLLAAIVTLDGESHWFEGVQLLALYAMVAIAVFFL
ncbi:MAG: calcium/proton exchanger [Gemmatimonadetes bacterium]|nr:calcium/proton exchanger [Gemmatimonadota bacterium]MBK7714310.1 calcium/proton exchanger [Gemmatimonadota bacterium]MBP6667963.1 calcium/proton exchanger [Gemmatimonadales bacterium]